MSRRGVTILELVVAIAIMSLLIAILLPAVQLARETARRAQCTSNLKQLGVAIHNYESGFGIFPPGMSNGYSLHVMILPNLEQESLSRVVNYSVGCSDDPRLASTSLQVLSCPSDYGGSLTGSYRTTNYVGNTGTGVQRYGFNGVFQILSNFPPYRTGPLRPRDVLDGLSNTAAMSELLVGIGTNEPQRSNWNTPFPLVASSQYEQFVDLCRSMPAPNLTDAWSRGRPWSCGAAGSTLYNHVLPPNQRSCINGTRMQEGAYSAASLHSAGVNVLFADGRVQFASNSISIDVWRAIGSRAGKESGSLNF